MDNFVSILQGSEAALIMTPVNRRYLTGFESSLGYLFITGKGATLLVDGRYILAAKQAVKSAEVVLLENSSKQLKALCSNSGIKRVLLESCISVARFKSFSEIFEGVECAADGRVEKSISELRKVKSTEETEFIVSAQRIAEKAFY